MKKKEILKLLNLRKDYTRTDVLFKLGSHVFPNIVDLKEEFQILKNEQQVAKEIHETSDKDIKELKCNHEVRITYHNIFTSHSSCTLCGTSINGDNCLNSTIYNDVNRNRYYASFPGSYDDEDYGFVQGVEEETIHKYILDILNNYTDEDEVDLVQEIKKLDLKDCTIYEKPFKKENYILIIGGSNKQYIGAGSYLTSKLKSLSLEIAHYFTGLSKVNVEVIESPESLALKKFQELFPYQYSNTKFVPYNTYEEIIKEINSLSGFCPFNLIINISNLNKYEVENGQIKQSKLDLNLKNLFPNSIVLSITEFQNLSKKEILEKLKEKILEFNMVIGYSTDYRDKSKFYSLQNGEDELKEDNELYNLCDKVKKLVFEK